MYLAPGIIHTAVLLAFSKSSVVETILFVSKGVTATPTDSVIFGASDNLVN